MTVSAVPAMLSNWSQTARSSCLVVRPRDRDEIAPALDAIRARGLSTVARGAAHSYADAALNTEGTVLDLRGLQRILAWDSQEGIMRVEAGATLADVARVALPDGWWLPVIPSTAEATVGGCIALNVTGKNAATQGGFGEHVLALDVQLADGSTREVSAARDGELFRALVGSAGLLGIITTATLQLRRIVSGQVVVRRHPARCLHDVFARFEEESSAEHLEGLLDGFASADALGRGIVTCTEYVTVPDRASRWFPPATALETVSAAVIRRVGVVGRPMLRPGVSLANRVAYWWSTRPKGSRPYRRSLVRASFFAPAGFAAYQTLLPHGMHALQAMVPRAHAEAVFADILRTSQRNDCAPLWCVVKRHRPDPFLLSYQLDGFSLETYYAIEPRRRVSLEAMLRALMERVLAAGGRFYLAKDALLTPALFRRSVGEDSVERFLELKRTYDPQVLFQSDLFHRVFQVDE